ncbi:MAG: hypothetical protein ACYCT2_09085 [Thermoplasmataceae archaeon]
MIMEKHTGEYGNVWYRTASQDTSEKFKMSGLVWVTESPIPKFDVAIHTGQSIITSIGDLDYHHALVIAENLADALYANKRYTHITVNTVEKMPLTLVTFTWNLHGHVQTVYSQEAAQYV